MDVILTSEIEALGGIDDARNCCDYRCCGAWRVAETDKLTIAQSKQINIEHMSGDTAKQPQRQQARVSSQPYGKRQLTKKPLRTIKSKLINYA